VVAIWKTEALEREIFEGGFQGKVTMGGFFGGVLRLWGKAQKGVGGQKL